MESQTHLNQKVQRFSEECRQKGLSVTHQRLAVYKKLAATKSHPTVEELYDLIVPDFPMMSLATVYKTLETFEKHGFVSKTRPTGEKARFDANLNPHHHLVCKVCGCIEDVYDEALSRINLPDTKTSNFRIEDFRVDFRGVCSECQ
ncbi:MAG: transcriptional repressor [Candidatus Omnitrophica bacterium]|nr:transcriptional repressor [Candidatus Omnitrophota bacterium]